jgi:hypothetical protein
VAVAKTPRYRRLHLGQRDRRETEGINKSYVSRILRLITLAPDIVEAILQGRVRQALMLQSLEWPLPANWQEQRRAFSVCRLGGHTAATLGTAAAGFRAFLHIVEPLAALRALRAHLRANSAGALMKLGPKFHEERTRAANLGACQHEPRVPWLDVFTAHVEAVLRERRQAHTVTRQAVVYAAPHLLVHRVHDLLHYCAATLARSANSRPRAPGRIRSRSI